MSILETLQHDIAARLDMLPAFAHVPALVARPRSEAEAVLIQNNIDQTLAGLLQKDGKGGATVLVQMPVIDVPEPNIPGPQFRATFVVRVLENPLINMGAAGTQLSAETISLNALSSLHHWDTGLAGSPLFADARAMEPNQDFPGKVAYDLFIRTRLGVAPEIRSPAVRADRHGNLIALTACGQPVRHTLDGTLPTFDSPLYESPITLAVNQTLRAASFQPETAPSDVLTISNHG